MITDAFDSQSPAIITPRRRESAPKADACIVTFSHEIEKHVAENVARGELASLWCATGRTPVYLIDRGEKRFAFYKTYVGAPITVALMEDAAAELDCRRFILFGGAGCLDREIAVRNADAVEKCMKKNGIPYALGKTWTTDSFYRETRNNFEKRRAEGCISVEMECAAVQAMCDFRGLELYAFFTGGDLLDAPEWDERGKDYGNGGQHDVGHFSIALALADGIT